MSEDRQRELEYRRDVTWEVEIRGGVRMKIDDARVDRGWTYKVPVLDAAWVELNAQGITKRTT